MDCIIDIQLIFSYTSESKYIKMLTKNILVGGRETSCCQVNAHGLFRQLLASVHFILFNLINYVILFGAVWRIYIYEWIYRTTQNALEYEIVLRRKWYCTLQFFEPLTKSDTGSCLFCLTFRIVDIVNMKTSTFVFWLNCFTD